MIFTSGTTDGINLVMHGWGRKFIGAGDEIILTVLEHHSNIVPWQMLAEEKGATIRVVPIDDAGELLIDEYEALFNARTRLVAVGHVSNALGTINPVHADDRLRARARRAGAGRRRAGRAAPARSTCRSSTATSTRSPATRCAGRPASASSTASAALLEAMQPFKGGGDMILSVTFEKTTYNTIPHKFEAGTPPIAAAIGLGAAVDYLSAIGMAAIAAHEHALLDYATAALDALPGVRIIGTAQHKAAVLSFALEGVHPHDVGTLLNEEGVAVRTGHHCAQPRDAALRRAGDLARVVRVLQHDGRSRRARRRHPQRAEGLRMSGPTRRRSTRK